MSNEQPQTLQGLVTRSHSSLSESEGVASRSHSACALKAPHMCHGSGKKQKSEFSANDYP